MAADLVSVVTVAETLPLCNFCEVQENPGAGAATKYQFCAKCRGAVYCSRECQLTDHQRGPHRRLCAYRTYVDTFNSGFVPLETWLEFSRLPSRLKAKLSYEHLPDFFVPFHDEILAQEQKLNTTKKPTKTPRAYVLVYNTFTDLCLGNNAQLQLMSTREIKQRCAPPNWDLLSPSIKSAVFVGGGRRGFLATHAEYAGSTPARLIVWVRGPIANRQN